MDRNEVRVVQDEVVSASDHTRDHDRIYCPLCSNAVHKAYRQLLSMSE